MLIAATGANHSRHSTNQMIGAEMSRSKAAGYAIVNHCSQAYCSLSEWKLVKASFRCMQVEARAIPDACL